MPTYHLGVVVDDLFNEDHSCFSGEEWLPSAPVHILLWKYLFGLKICRNGHTSLDIRTKW
jgi:glutamyl-tRNA synthetase